MSERLRIDVWSDIVCPFCWIGKRHLEEAVNQLDVQEDVEVVHRAFLLDALHSDSRPLVEHLAQKFGGESNMQRMIAHVRAMGEGAGLAFDFERAVSASTFDGHRLVRLAGEHGLADAMVERLMRAHFTEAADLADASTLTRLAAEVGLTADMVGGFLRSKEHSDAVVADIREARALGAGGVPFFVFDGRFAVAGAQPVEVFVEALRRARSPASPETG